MGMRAAPSGMPVGAAMAAAAISAAAAAASVELLCTLRGDRSPGRAAARGDCWARGSWLREQVQ